MSRDTRKILSGVLRDAKQAGATDADAFYQSNRELSVEVRDGRVQSVKQADSSGLGVRVFLNGSAALVYTSDFREDALRSLVERAVVLAKSTPPDEANLLAAPSGGAEPKLEMQDPAVSALGPDDLISRALETEKVARAADPRVTGTQYAGASRTDAEVHLVNSRGVDRHHPATSVSVFLGVLADDADGKQRTGSDGSSQRFLADLRTPAQIGAEAAKRAVRMVGARKVATERLPVLMHPDVAGGWMSSVFGAFSGEQVFKGASYLADKLGETVGSPLVTLVDDPLRRRALGGAPCDDEGTPTRRTVLLEKGKVSTFVYDLKWASKAGKTSTGHAQPRVPERSAHRLPQPVRGERRHPGGGDDPRARSRVLHHGHRRVRLRPRHRRLVLCGVGAHDREGRDHDPGDGRVAGLGHADDAGGREAGGERSALRRARELPAPAHRGDGALRDVEDDAGPNARHRARSLALLSATRGSRPRSRLPTMRPAPRGAEEERPCAGRDVVRAPTSRIVVGRGCPEEGWRSAAGAPSWSS